MSVGKQLDALGYSCEMLWERLVETGCYPGREAMRNALSAWRTKLAENEALLARKGVRPEEFGTEA